MAQKVANVYVKLSADSAELINDLDRAVREARKFGREVNKQSNRIKYAFNKIRRAAQVIASAFIFTAGVKQLGRLVASVEMAEEKMALMQARFRQFGRSGNTFVTAYKQSIELGVSIDTVAEGMTRLFVATKNLGTTETDIAKVQKNIVLLGRAGGTSAEEMKGALRQLSQGMASNRLAGEELRSVLENLPLVAYEIADQLGIGIGKIREFGAQGKISAQVVIDAMKELNIDVSDLPETFSMSTARIRTEWDLTLAALGKKLETSGILSLLEEGLRSYRQNVLGDFSTFSQGELLQEIADAEAAINNVLKDRQKIVAQGGSEFYREADLQRLRERLNALQYYLDESVKAYDLAAKAGAARGEASEIFVPLDPTKVRPLLEKRTKYLIDEMNRLLKEAELDDESLEPIPFFKMKMPRVAEEGFDRVEAMADQAARNIQDAFADFLFDPFEDGVKGMLKGFLDAIRRMIAEMAALELFGEGSGFHTFFKGLFKRASGGSVTSGTPYMVGERGPELFVPGASGTIIPNHKLASASGMAISYNIDARGADEATIIARMVPLLERTIQITKGEIRQDMREGRFR